MLNKEFGLVLFLKKKMKETGISQNMKLYFQSSDKKKCLNPLIENI